MARALVRVAGEPSAWGRVWHAPTNPAKTQTEVLQDVAASVGRTHRQGEVDAARAAVGRRHRGAACCGSCARPSTSSPRRTCSTPRRSRSRSGSRRRRGTRSAGPRPRTRCGVLTHSPIDVGQVVEVRVLHRARRLVVPVGRVVAQDASRLTVNVSNSTRCQACDTGPVRVGLTGGIASGKSTVATILVELGAVLIDGDALAREVVARGTPGLAQVVEEFGEELLTPEGDLDRAGAGPDRLLRRGRPPAARGDHPPADLRAVRRARGRRARPTRSSSTTSRCWPSRAAPTPSTR